MHVFHLLVRDQLVVDRLEGKVQLPDVDLVVLVSVHVVEGPLVVRELVLVDDAVLSQVVQWVYALQLLQRALEGLDVALLGLELVPVIIHLHVCVHVHLLFFLSNSFLDLLHMHVHVHVCCFYLLQE